MTPLVWLLSIWGVLTTILVVLLIYRSTLTMHEEDQLFLSESESHMEKEQIELMKKVNMLNPFVRWLWVGFGVLLLTICGMLAYQGLNNRGL